VRVLDDPRPVVGAIRQALSGFGAAGPAGRHADLGETAAMLATRPELVRMERVTAGFQGEVGLGELLANGTRALSLDPPNPPVTCRVYAGQGPFSPLGHCTHW
jgi:hypothetical protein